MKLVVLDPGLDSTAGHHYHLDLVLREQGRRRGWMSWCYGYKGMDPLVSEQFDARLVFDMHCYAQVAAVPEMMLIHNRSVSNDSFHRNLCEKVGQDFDADDIIVMHTVLGNQLTGLYLWYRDLPEPRPRLCLILRLPPSFHLSAENHDSAAALDRQALALWRKFPEDRVRIVCDNQGLGRYYGALTGLDIPDLPIPIRYPQTRAARRRPPRPTAAFRLSRRGTVGEGHPATRRGAEGAARPAPGRAVHDPVRPARDAGRYPAGMGAGPPRRGFPRPQPERRRLPEPAVRRRRRHRAVPSRDLRRPDLPCLPRGGRGGQAGPDHSGTWMDMELDRLGHTAVRAHDFSAIGIGAALVELAGGWRTLAEEAPAAGERCRALHNPEVFFQRLLDLFPA